jgi:H+/Cl- antiporter ClcA
MSTANLSFMQRLRLRENHIFFALTIIIGILAGLAAVLFTLAIKGTTYLLFGIAPSNLRYILVPTLMSLATGILLVKFFPEARGSGVPQIEAAYHLNQGEVPFRVAFGKFLTGVLCIGSGHSMGREGPSVQIGAGIASPIGKWFHLSPARVQSLVPVAAAAALSAAFNTPVAAVIFALEEIIGDMNATLLGSTVVASVAAVIVERSILGNNPIFHVPAYHLVNPAELIGYLVLGIAGGIVSLAFCKGLLRSRKLFLRMPKLQIHPAQYLLVGFGLAIFFLLLVSFSEHMAFELSYLIASVACIGLLTFYLSYVLRSVTRGVAFGGILTTLYAAVYGLLISEDNALVLGSLMLFAVLAVVMVVTRKVDWYKGSLYLMEAATAPPLPRPTQGLGL